MKKYVAFLRGINVGGNNIISMNDLKSALAKSKFKNIQTYINSGNIVLESNDDKEKVKELFEKTIVAYFKLKIDVTVKTQKELDEIILNNPFNSKKENENSKRIVVMLSDKVSQDQALQLKSDERIVENYYLKDDLLYIYYHDGAGRSKFTTSYIDRKLKVTSTARNWNTMLKMNEMLKEI
jgi:uncharacterized protein (DUF1697 family)